ncbi:MAG TPA: helix-turn-helix domain-containing protein, partial [Jatrophihabitans sp.]|nr:helix-turn-helix domain-containing protein [Jatrophihabitans sp.]
MTGHATSASAKGGPAVRERVLDAAVELFADQGYDGTSVAQVIGRAGVAKGGFYHHFASKEQLL